MTPLLFVRLFAFVLMANLPPAYVRSQLFGAELWSQPAERLMRIGSTDIQIDGQTDRLTVDGRVHARGAS